ncbi:coatomer subunit beta [Nematocida homosporus]|uniref:coatomer subunit beta n=1 Tax=Nematocida homosporus TaxID=1912981 RepID=UPI002220793A|nr:coatomer subunit beta [Nematocida homosporus]KAI5186817.1 coatomer subunit beta [Nematocida homosporus]
MANSRVLYISRDRQEPWSKETVKMLLSKGSDQDKVCALWQIVKEMAMGVDHQDLLLVLSMCVPNSKDKRLIVLFYQYMEGIEVETAEGNLKDEVLMVCNMMRVHLSHPNEHIRARVLRTLGRIGSPALFDSLKAPFVDNLSYSNPVARTAAYLALRMLLQNPETAYLFEDTLEKIKSTYLPGERDPICLAEGYRTLELANPEGALELYYSMRSTPHEGVKECFLQTAARIQDIDRIIEIAKESNSRGVALEGGLGLISLCRESDRVQEAAEGLLDMATEYLDAESKIKIIRAFADAKRRGSCLFEGMAMKVARLLNSALARVNRAAATEVFEFVLDILGIVEARDLFTYLEQQFMEGTGKETKEFTAGLSSRVFFLSALQRMLLTYRTTSSALSKAVVGLLGSSLPELALGAVEYLTSLMQIMGVSQLPDIIEQLGEIKYGKILRHVFCLVAKYADQNQALTAIKVLQESLGSGKESILGSIGQKQDLAKIFPGVSIARFLLELAGQSQISSSTDKDLRQKIVTTALKVCALGQKSGSLDESSRVALLKTAETVAAHAITLPSTTTPIPAVVSTPVSTPVSNRPFFTLVKKQSRPEQASRLEEFIQKPESPSLFKIKNIFQMSSVIDPLYCECQVTCNRSEIILDTLFVNQTDVLLESLEMDIVTSSNIRLINSPVIGSLRPHTAHTFTITLLIEEADSGFIGGVITSGRIGRDDFFLQNLQEIRFNLADMLTQRQIDREEFKEKWALLLWENFYTITLAKYAHSLAEITNAVLASTQGTVVDTRAYEKGAIQSSDTSSPDILVKNIFATTIQGTDVYINALLYRTSEGAVASFRIRGQKCRAVKSFCQLISRQLKSLILT